MKIDFNNVRRQACIAFDGLINELNAAKEYEGYMLIDPNDIEEKLSDLRGTLAAIASSYEEGEEDVKDVYSEMYPASQGKQIAIFDWKPQEE